jgi:hypothetical protein
MLPFGASHIPIALIVLPLFAGRLVWRLARGEQRVLAAPAQVAAAQA